MLDFNSQPSATTCCEPDGSNLRLLNLKQNDNFKSKSVIDKSDTNLDTNSVNGMDFDEIWTQWCEFEAELCNLNLTSALTINLISNSASLIDVPILQEGRYLKILVSQPKRRSRRNKGRIPNSISCENKSNLISASRQTNWLDLATK